MRTMFELEILYINIYKRCPKFIIFTITIRLRGRVLFINKRFFPKAYVSAAGKFPFSSFLEYNVAPKDWMLYIFLKVHRVVLYGIKETKINAESILEDQFKKVNHCFMSNFGNIQRVAACRSTRTENRELRCTAKKQNII